MALATKDGHPEVVRLLLQQGVEVNDPDPVSASTVVQDSNAKYRLV